MKSDVKITGDGVQINRIFNAPRERVFAAWKNPDLLKQWTGCKGATKVEVQMDFRVGGSFTQKMFITGAGEFSFTGKYIEIVEPEKIVYDANLGPAITRVVVEFIEQGRHTKVVVRQERFPDQKFANIVAQGTMESFDKLEHLLVTGSGADSSRPASA